MIASNAINHSFLGEFMTPIPFVATMQCVRFRTQRLQRFIGRHALIVCFALLVIPASHAAVCSMDIDGNGRIEATTDGLLMMRYMLGIRGTALVSGALGAGASRALPADIENYLATPCAQAGWVGQGTGRLNDTGITFGGEPLSGNNPGCTSTGANIAQQDCSKGRDANPSLNGAADGVAGFSFTKISNAGSALPASATLGGAANDWACTYDNVTGLTWEVKTTSGRRSNAHTYTWFSADASNNAGATGTAGGGACGDAAGTCDTEKFAATTNVETLCGRNDWRMPHVKELESIAHHGVFNPSIDAAWFPNTAVSFFWSGSPVAGGATLAWAVYFVNGNVSVVGRSDANLVRLVRAGQ